MTILPLFILDLRIFILYYGWISFEKRRWQFPPVRNLCLDQTWLLITFAKLIMPFAVGYLFLVFIGDPVDWYFLVPLQVLYLLMFLVVILMLMRLRTQLKQHHLETTRMSMSFWLVVTFGIIYSNLSWYLFEKIFGDGDSARILSMEYFINILIYDVQIVIVMAMWYWHYTKIRASGIDLEITSASSSPEQTREIQMVDVDHIDCNSECDSEAESHTSHALTHVITRGDKSTQSETGRVNSGAKSGQFESKSEFSSPRVNSAKSSMRRASAMGIPDSTRGIHLAAHLGLPGTYGTQSNLGAHAGRTGLYPTYSPLNLNQTFTSLPLHIPDYADESLYTNQNLRLRRNSKDAEDCSRLVAVRRALESGAMLRRDESVNFWSSNMDSDPKGKEILGNLERQKISSNPNFPEEFNTSEVRLSSGKGQPGGTRTQLSAPGSLWAYNGDTYSVQLSIGERAKLTNTRSDLNVRTYLPTRKRMYVPRLSPATTSTPVRTSDHLCALSPSYRKPGHSKSGHSRSHSEGNYSPSDISLKLPANADTGPIPSAIEDQPSPLTFRAHPFSMGNENQSVETTDTARPVSRIWSSDDRGRRPMGVAPDLKKWGGLRRKQQ
ncbi:hypothetical protein SARC_09058 [Sphaeroforma arctica JP610]|uniref:Uncharacterized protein n=1 Tax=Sphaeroforma arctica JP610 TaxID=667725 RepID=A0A0L0FR88_9EUKA|nr:hypothetical protein SARC_09058 [Sphaeroforma arctica JP610]KNC78513.1 hypothetical protein SARC_09058 [Sphaeroforma arctica JP610]|eukprot:XP_014152415.1 hypothetical protein SARC_09058 [Sphaeroforma arctica JP610]